MAECKENTINNVNIQKQSVKIGHNDSQEENKTDKVMEPLLLEDMKGGNLPRIFRKVQTVFQDMDILLDRNDYFFLLIHILMLESGFVTEECKDYFNDKDFGFHYRRVLDAVCKLPSTWKRSNTVYSVRYVLPPFVQYLCKVTCTECGDDIIVNSSIEGIECDNYSLLVDPKRFIMSSVSNISNKFQDIAHLSCIFKASISSPVRNVIMRYNNCPAFCLEDLPVEILLYIMRYFDPKTLAMFERSCKTFRSLSHDPSVWKKIIGSKWESFQNFKRNENAKKSLWSRYHYYGRRVD